MKKILSTAAAIALAASLISCGDSGDSYSSVANGAVDTVLSISAPVVTKSVAYAGVNYIAWNPVADATQYEIYRTADGAASGTYLTAVNAKNGTAYADVATSANVLVDGVTYNYTIVALGANGPSSAGTAIPTRSIYLRPNSTTTAVKAYVPAAGTAITDFTDLYTKNFLSLNYKDAETIAKKAKITFVNDVVGGGDLYASFPATAGYEFGVKFINKSQPEYILKSKAPASFSTLYLENYTANKNATTLGAGEYEAYLTIKSVCGFYPTTVVHSLGTYTVPALAVTTGTSVVSASATGSRFTAEKKARIEWNPAILASGAVAPTTNYKVYRTEGTLDDGKTLVPVTAEVKTFAKYSNGDGDNIDTIVTGNAAATGSVNTVTTVYYIEDEVPAAGKYTYFVVNTDGKEFEKTNSGTAYNSVTVGPYAQNTTAAPKISWTLANESTSSTNTIKITAIKGKRDDKFVVTQKLALSYVKLDDKVTSGTGYQRVLPGDFTACAALANNDETEESYIAYDVKAAYGTYLFKLTATEDGYAPQSTYQIVQADYCGADINTNGINLVWTNPNSKYQNQTAVAWFTGSTNDMSLYNYEWVTVTETISDKPYTVGGYDNYVTVSTAKADLKWEAGASVKADDWNDADKAWRKYLRDNIAQRNADLSYKTNGKTGDDLRYLTYPYATKDISAGEHKDGITVRQTVSVKVTLKANTNIYKFTDNDGRTANNMFTIAY